MLNSINTNIAAYFAQQNINAANSSVSGSVGRLSSGSRIVRASDDVAAMSVGTSLRSTVSTLKMGLLNASQGSSMLQVADGALGKIQDMLLRQKALATQATSGSLTSAERGFLDQEFQNLTQEIDRLVQNTNFNGVKLLDGTLGGTTTDLAETNAISATLVVDATNNIAASSVAIQAFDITGDETSGVVPHAGGVSADVNAAGEILLVDAADTALTNAGFLGVNQNLVGAIGEITFSNFVEGVSAQVSVEINGITFTGAVAHEGAGANAGAFTVRNGNTYIKIGYDGMDLTSKATTKASIEAVNDALKDVRFMQTTQLEGVNFNGTVLEGVSFNANSGSVMMRMASGGDVTIDNFQYISNLNAANTNVLSVQINGETWYANNVADDPADLNGDSTRDDPAVITFTNGKQEVMQLDLTGIDPDLVGNMRTDEIARKAFIDALNKGFSGLNKGVDFALGTEVTDKLTVAVGKSSTDALFGRESLSITTMADALHAGEVLNDAIKMVTTIRANVGAMMSRFDFASANIEIALQNQDAARGVLLDTDVAAESSAYATAQVQLQAGIAVLAQANQLPQNLLKLIG